MHVTRAGEMIDPSLADGRGPEETVAFEARFVEKILELGNRLLAQSAAMGALPTLYAATAPQVQGGDYFGPASLGEMWGNPRKVGATARARNPADAARLWELSEALTGVSYAALP